MFELLSLYNNKNVLQSMKNVVAVLIALLLLNTSCEDADDNDNIIPGKNLFERISENSELTQLKTALEITSLDFTLSNTGSFTLFAPTDAAFNQYLSANGFTDLNAVPVDDLRNLLQYHLLQTLTRSEDFLPGYAKTSANNLEQQQNLDLYIQTAPTLLLNGTTAITTGNVTGNNGILHIVDNVLSLPTVATLVQANPDFSNLLIALNQEGLTTTLENMTTTGTNPAPYTVFGPSNAAFQALIDESTTDSLNTFADVLALPNLTDILLNHVVSGSSLRGESFSDGIMIDPITAGMLTVNTTGGAVITDQTSRLVSIIGIDLTATNGVLHILNNVLLPQ